MVAVILLTLIFGALGTGAIYTMFNPITLPDSVVVFIAQGFIAVKAWDGILPLTAIIDCISITFNILVAYLLVRFLLWLVATASGGHEPDL